MPYQSKAQQGLFHSKQSPVDAKTVQVFDQATKGHYGQLPEHVKKRRGKEVFKARLKDAMDAKHAVMQQLAANLPPAFAPKK
jgi:hypothetical protein